MFKQIASGLNKFFNRKELILLVVALLVGVALLSYSNSKVFSVDGLSDGQTDDVPSSYSEQTNQLAKQPTVSDTNAQHVVPAPKLSESEQPGSNYVMRPVNDVSDLLPNDPNSEWAKLNPGLNAGATPDLLSPGQYIGISRTPLRNSNLQYRSDPVISKQNVGPWHQSTIDQDISRIPLEIGYN